VRLKIQDGRQTFANLQKFAKLAKVCSTYAKIIC